MIWQRNNTYCCPLTVEATYLFCSDQTQFFMFIPHAELLLTQHDFVASNRDCYILSLVYTEIIRFHPEFSVAFVNLKTIRLRAKPVLSSTPVVLLCLWRWVCQHHKLSGNNIIPSIGVGIPLLIPLLILLFGDGRKEHKGVCLHYFLLEYQLCFDILVAHGKVLFFFCLILTGFG